MGHKTLENHANEYKASIRHHYIIQVFTYTYTNLICPIGGLNFVLFCITMHPMIQPCYKSGKIFLKYGTSVMFRKSLSENKQYPIMLSHYNGIKTHWYVRAGFNILVVSYGI